MQSVLIAFGLTLLAGLATGIGSTMAFWTQRTNYRFLSIATGFSAGVMLYVSFVEIFFKGQRELESIYGDYWSYWINAGSFFSGMLLIALVDNLIPAADNPHETHSEEERAPLHDPLAPYPDFTAMGVLEDTNAWGSPERLMKPGKLMRMGTFTALAITIHNFPEGLATFLAALHDPKVGVAIAVAIALHNIPEGISVAVPIFYATGNRKKAFIYSLLSGLAEPVGAAIAYFFLLLVTNDPSAGISNQLMGILFGAVAGIMVYISLDELLPASRTYGKGHDSILGLTAGMVVMAVSLLLMR